MDTPGYILKTERERQRKSLEEIAGTLKLNIEYLKAIESEQYQNIPAEIYTKAYLRFYARELGLDSDHIIQIYHNQLPSSSAHKPASAQKSLSEGQKPRYPLKPFIIIAAVVFFILLIVFLARFRETPVETASEKMEQKATETTEPKMKEEPQLKEEPGPPGIKEQAKQEHIPETKEPELINKDLQEIAPVQGQGSKTLSLTVNAKDTVWISVGIDSNEPKEWLLKNGENVSLTASEKFIIKTGNAGGTQVIFNGKDMGVLGQKGEVSDIVLAGSGDRRP
ncbi:MAG: helix-turn-helix domain-containing protein [Nitrospiraceae bacterium]|nr:MAG: helix-turn-helix domain-containing protein [Nitrospiraceae bacterium]